MARNKASRAKGGRDPGRICITGGSCLGRALRVPAGRAVRPTANGTRQAIFNILESGRLTASGGAPYIGGCVLDLFCGTGAMAAEALSRGAARAVLVDNDPAHLKLAEENLRLLGLGDRAAFLKLDASRAPAPRYGSMSAVFLDPPYQTPLGAKALQSFAAANWLAPGCVAVWETAASLAKPVPPRRFAELDRRDYGAARVTVLAVRDDAA